MSAWRCTKCGCTLTWFFNFKPTCPYCVPRNEGGSMERVPDK